MLGIAQMQLATKAWNKYDYKKAFSYSNDVHLEFSFSHLIQPNYISYYEIRTCWNFR